MSPPPRWRPAGQGRRRADKAQSHHSTGRGCLLVCVFGTCMGPLAHAASHIPGLLLPCTPSLASGVPPPGLLPSLIVLSAFLIHQSARPAPHMQPMTNPLQMTNPWLTWGSEKSATKVRLSPLPAAPPTQAPRRRRPRRRPAAPAVLPGWAARRSATARAQCGRSSEKPVRPEKSKWD
jgi:hypothetical protein